MRNQVRLDIKGANLTGGALRCREGESSVAAAKLGDVFFSFPGALQFHNDAVDNNSYSHRLFLVDPPNCQSVHAMNLAGLDHRDRAEQVAVGGNSQPVQRMQPPLQPLKVSIWVRQSSIISSGVISSPVVAGSE